MQGTPVRQIKCYGLYRTVIKKSKTMQNFLHVVVGTVVVTAPDSPVNTNRMAPATQTKC